MPSRRRIVALAGAAAVGGGFTAYHGLTGCDETACFEFEYHGADDAANRLDVRHTGGRETLRAGDVYFDEVVVDWESRETGARSWAELDGELEAEDVIDGDEIRLRLMTGTDIVEIQWRRDDDERVVEAWVYDDDVS
ncbi:hypothetical protein [Halorubrum sp. LN27]|uniref:hypothetical protein n=1 Tax=Halorubrum sp. LN27 TaxID=2801032 RepID=UPI0019093904|nr:hypothetical protein [Halorubrum sp. LN27]